MPLAARIADNHACPIPGHAVNPIVSGSPDVVVGFMPAARVGDTEACGDAIAMGSSNVLINFRPAARLGDPTVHGGKILVGCPTVDIGETPQSFTLKAAAANGSPFCEECEKAKKELEKQALGAPETPPPDSITAPEVVTPKKQPPKIQLKGVTELEVEIAAAPGASNEQMAARAKVARAFYAQHGVKYVRPSGEKPMPIAEIRSHIKGIDFTKPLSFGPPPPLPTDLHQWQRAGWSQGQYYAHDSAEPTHLGIHHSANDKHRAPEVAKERSHYKMDLAGPYLVSVAAPYRDKHSLKNETRMTLGGALQYYVPNRPHAKLHKKGG
ncbi:MAG: PAAR domain-containing protein [Polyangiaceae bacterium]